MVLVWLLTRMEDFILLLRGRGKIISSKGIRRWLLQEALSSVLDPVHSLRFVTTHRFKAAREFILSQRGPSD